MKNIKAVIFDFDGLLINSDILIFDATKKYLVDFKINLNKADFREIFGLSGLDFAKAIVEKYALDVTVQEALDKLISLIDYSSVKLKPFAEELVRSLRGKYKIYVATNSSKESFKRKSKNISGILREFDDIITIDNIKPKPDPEIYLKVAQKYNFQPSECCVLEDSEIGVKSAVEAGCLTIFVPNNFVKDPAKVSKKYGVVACNSLNEVISIIKEGSHD